MIKGPQKPQIGEIQTLGITAQAQPNYIAQVLSGFRHPQETSGSEKLPGKAYTPQDYQNIALYIHAKIKPPQEIFRQMQEGLAALKGDTALQIRYLKNANVFIQALIRADERQEFLPGVRDGLQSFLTQGLDSPNINTALDEIRNAAEKTIQKVTEIKDQKYSIVNASSKKDGAFNFHKFIHEISTASDSDITKAVKKVVSDLGELNLSMLRTLNPSDFHDKKWTRPQFAGKLDLSRSTESFNRISNMVSQDIMLAKDKQQQMQIFKFYTEVAHGCLKQGNYNGAFQILSGLDKAYITRLKYLSGGSEKKVELCDEAMRKNLNLFTKLCDVFDVKQNYAAYKAHKADFEKKGGMVIPPMPLEGRTFLMSEEGNLDLIEETDKGQVKSRVNGMKMEMLGQFEAQLQKAQDSAFRIQPRSLETNLSSRISYPKLSEEALEARSYQMLPYGQQQPDFKFYENPNFKTNPENKDPQKPDTIRVEFSHPEAVLSHLDMKRKYPDASDFQARIREVDEIRARRDTVAPKVDEEALPLKGKEPEEPKPQKKEKEPADPEDRKMREEYYRKLEQKEVKNNQKVGPDGQKLVKSPVIEIRPDMLPPRVRAGPRVGPEGQTLQRVHAFKLDPSNKEGAAVPPEVHPLVPPSPEKPIERIEVPDPMADEAKISEDVQRTVQLETRSERKKFLNQAPEARKVQPDLLSPEGLKSAQSARKFWQGKDEPKLSSEEKPKKSGPKI